MRKTSVLTAILLAAAFALPGRALLADGMIYVDIHRIPPPRPFVPVPRPEFPLQVTKHRVEVRIDDAAARTRVEETFHNPNGFQLEGTYLFPLPPGASVSNFVMKIGGKEVGGEVLERDKARTIYESIVRQSRDPGLLEFVERGLFRARVFPIPALGDVDVRVEYDEGLPLTGGFGRYRYPLNTGKYSAGDYRDVLIDLTLKSSAPLRSVNSPSHAVSVTRNGDKEARVVFEAKTLTADKDFILDWNVGEDALAPALLTFRGYEPDGFFWLSISPRPEGPKSAPPKDLVAVIDSSGSMLGKKMDEARSALRHFVNGLHAGDRFDIVDFATEARKFRDGLVEASDENRKQGLAYIDSIPTRGGTNIEEALRIALDALDRAGDDGRLKMVVLVTDGEPTVGITRPEDIARSIREKNQKSRRIFAFGIGADLNAQLLDRLAAENHGAADYVLAGENIEVKLSAFWDKIDFPVLTDLRAEFPNQRVTDVYPKPLPDLFRGETLIVVGRYAEDGRHAVVLRGKFQGEEKVFEYSLDFTPVAAAGTRNDFVARLWATRKIGYLREAMRLSGESKEVKDEVIRLSQQYGIITPYTSYLILEDTDRRRIAGEVPRAAPAAEALRKGFGGAGGRDGADLEGRVRSAGRELEESTGEKAVAGSIGLRSMKDAKGDAAAPATSAAPGASGGAYDFLRRVNEGQRRIQQVGSRAFYLQGERWVEGGLKETEIASAKRIEYLSDAYFDLLKEPGIGEVLAVGSKVTFRWKGETIAIQ